MKFELKKKIIQIAILSIVMACTAGVTQRIGHDSDGKEIKRISGEKNYDSLKKEIDEIL